MKFILVLLLLILPFSHVNASQQGVRIKELSRIATERDNMLVGYGIVTGLSGSGDSPRAQAANQSIANILKRFGVQITGDQIRARNTAAVMIITTLPAFAQNGDKLDVNVSSLGDARSLVGGTLLMTSLSGPDDNVYALAQGPLSVGGFSYDLNGNIVQKNHPTAATIPAGATVERTLDDQLIDPNGIYHYILHNPDITTASRMASKLNQQFGSGVARPISPGKIELTVPKNYQNNDFAFLSEAENIQIQPDRRAKIVVNERTGTVVSGGDVSIAKTSITHGNLRVIINTEYSVSQPTFVSRTGDGVNTAIIPNTTLDVNESGTASVSLPDYSSVDNLVAGLNKVHASSRDIISVLQALKRAGALHAEIIIQ